MLSRLPPCPGSLSAAAERTRFHHRFLRFNCFHYAIETVKNQTQMPSSTGTLNMYGTKKSELNQVMMCRPGEISRPNRITSLLMIKQAGVVPEQTQRI
jgi:hypothetical protein